MARLRSTKALVIRYFTVLLIATVVCFAGFFAYSVNMYAQQILYCNEAALNIYSNNFLYTLKGMESFSQDVYSNESFFRLLAYRDANSAVSKKLQYEYHLRQTIQNGKSICGATFLFNVSGSTYYYHYDKNFLGGIVNRDSMRMMRQVRDYWVSASPSLLTRWQVLEVDGHVFLTTAWQLNDLYLCSLLDLDSFRNLYTDDGDSIQYLFYTEDRLLTNAEDIENVSVTGLIAARSNVLRDLFNGHLVWSRFFDPYGIGMIGIIPLSGVWEMSRTVLLLFVIILALLCTMFAVVYSFISRILVYPLKQITSVSQQLANASQAPPQPYDENLQEFVTIRNALNDLVRQKSRLEQENISKTQEKEHALLQYYQLQTRSHFFLNCLKSLYSMAESGEAEKIKRMIVAFSNHLRYIFHDNLSLVNLSSELAEVQDYYQIIQMDRPSPLLLKINVPQELMNCKVPPLIIQTFLENSYKYNSATDKLLCFTVRADAVDLDGNRHLCLRMSDNGVGYSAEMLDKLKSDSEKFEQYHVGISNIKRRIGLIYKDNYQLLFYNAQPNGSACSVIYLPLISSAEEVKE